MNTDSNTPDLPTPRRFVSITRAIGPSGGHIIDAIADDGTAWHAVLQRDAGLNVSSWRQILPLPPIS
jgi:hypothetical protein